MAARVSQSTVSYGIGVQNRYSAFLEEDDGFGPPAIHLPATNNVVVKSVSLNNNNKKNATQKPNASSKVAVGKAASGKQPEAQQKQNQATNGHKGVAKVEVNRRQQQQPRLGQLAQNVSLQQQQQQFKPASNGKQVSNFHNNDNSTDSNNKYPARNQQYNGMQQHNHHHYHQANYQNNNKENQIDVANQPAGRFNNRGIRDQRANNSRHRQFSRDDDKRATQTNGTSFDPNTEEEKHRRQQKRFNDLRHKDPEKNAARRIQATADSTSDEKVQQANENQVDDPSKLRGPARLRRDGEKYENGPRAYKGNRIRRGIDGEATVTASANVDRRGDELQQDRRRVDGERSQRNRNGFGRGSGSRPGFDQRGARGVEGVSKNVERQKPIPNFSDKSDFPSLAS